MTISGPCGDPKPRWSPLQRQPSDKIPEHLPIIRQQPLIIHEERYAHESSAIREFASVLSPIDVRDFSYSKLLASKHDLRDPKMSFNSETTASSESLRPLPSRSW